MTTVMRFRKAIALFGLTVTTSGLVAALAPAPASAASAFCGAWISGRAGYVQCHNYGKQFRTVALCEHLVSGRTNAAFGDWVTSPSSGSGVSIAECGVDYRVVPNKVAWEFR